MVKLIDLETEYKKECCKDIADNVGCRKFGFSLVEVLVSMLILSLFFLATTKVLTQKQKVEFQKSPHGYYECYIVDGNLYAHRVDGASVADAYETSSCYANTPKGVNFVNLYYIQPGNPGRYYNSQEPIFNLEFNYDSPEAFAAELQSLGLDLSGAGLSEDDKMSQWNGDKTTFYNYLVLCHPESKILTVWQNKGGLNADPPEAILVAW